MNKYSILREDYGDEDREIIIYDVWDSALRTIVSSHNSEQDAQRWIDEQRAIDYRVKNSLVAA